MNRPVANYQIDFSDIIIDCGGAAAMSRAFVVCDQSDPARRDKLGGHISQDDYFGTLATIIDILIHDSRTTDQKRNEVLASLRDDLVYLQENFRIVEK